MHGNEKKSDSSPWFGKSRQREGVRREELSWGETFSHPLGLRLDNFSLTRISKRPLQSRIEFDPVGINSKGTCDARIPIPEFPEGTIFDGIWNGIPFPFCFCFLFYFCAFHLETFLFYKKNAIWYHCRYYDY